MTEILGDASTHVNHWCEAKRPNPEAKRPNPEAKRPNPEAKRPNPYTNISAHNRLQAINALTPAQPE